MPTFSVIISTYARPRQLAACLTALAQQSYPHDCYEVIVVDDGSPQPPAAAVAAVTGVAVKLLIADHNGISAARNLGLAHAAGEYVAFTDDDCMPAADWLASLAANFSQHPRAGIGGRVENALPNDLCATASQLLVSYLVEYFNACPDGARFFTTNNLAFPTATLRDLGGFDTRYARVAGEDRELCDRWRSLGLALRYAPDAVVYHARAMELVGFWRQHFNYGRGALRFHLSRATRQAQPIRLEPWRFYAGYWAIHCAMLRARPLPGWWGCCCCRRWRTLVVSWPSGSGDDRGLGFGAAFCRMQA
jgi:GT2 family glycosyltransferase